MRLPEDIDDDGASIFLGCYFIEQLVHFLHYQQVGTGLCFDIAEGKMPTGQKIPLHR